MTVPMQFDRPNVVVGRNLMEFLALGCASGYFQLEQLSYAELNAALTPSGEADAEELLAMLRSTFTLEPWPSVQKRLEELQGELISGTELHTTRDLTVEHRHVRCPYAACVTAVLVRARGVRRESTEFPGWLEVSVNDSSGHPHPIVEKVPVLTTADVAPTEDLPDELWIRGAYVRMEGTNVVVQLAHGVATREGLEILTVAPEDVRWV